MLEYIISLSVLIALVLIIRAVFRKKVSPRLMYALWLVVVIRMVVPISFFEFEVPLPDFFKTEQVFKTEDTLPDSEITHNHENYYPIDPPIGQIYPIDPPTAVDKPNTNYNPNEDIISVTPPINKPDDIVTDDEIVDPIIDEPQQNIIDVKRICDIVWLSGALICGGWILTASVIFNTRLYRDRTLHRIVRGTRVYVSPSVGVPCVAGFIPAIYLTPDCANSKSETLTIIHEKIHLRHGDHIWGIVRALAIIVFWYNPLVWVAASKSKQDAELACDDAISSKIDSDVRFQYANILLDFAPQKRRYALELSGAPIKERILMLTTKHKYKLVSAVLALLLTVTAVGCAFVSIGDKEDETDFEFEEQSVEDENNDELNDIGHGPFIGYVADEETPWIDLYTEKNGAYVGCIPYKIFHDWIATDRNSEGWTPGWESDYIHFYYAEFGDFRWAAAHLTSTVMGSGRKNIATSTDGGQTWSFGSTMDDYGGNHVTGIGFESAKVAVMCFDSMYEHDIFTEEGMVLPIVLSRTEDSGKTWTRTEIAVPSYLENYRTRPSVPKLDGAVGRIPIDVYDADYKVVDTVYLVSLDAGLTWEWEDKHFDPDEFASYIPNESAKFEFWHKMFASETYLYFCSVREYNSDGASYTDAPPRDFAVYYVDASDPSTIGRIDAKLPEELEYDSVMPVFAGAGGGSGECMFILRLTNKGETSYVQFNNFSYSDYTNWLEFEYGGVLSEKELAMYYSDISGVSTESLLMSALENKTMLYTSNSSKAPYLDEYIDENEVIKKYAFVDMNGDSDPELVLWLARGENNYCGYVVLHRSRDVVYAYSFPYRAMNGIKSNGTFISSSGAFDLTVCSLDFNGASCSETVVARRQGDGTSQKYYVGNKAATEEEFNQYYERYSISTLPVWYSYTEDAITDIEEWDSLFLIDNSTGEERRCNNVYTFIKNFVKGESHISEINDLKITDYSVSLLIDSNYDSLFRFDFTVTGDSLIQTVPPGRHSWMLSDTIYLTIYRGELVFDGNSYTIKASEEEKLNKFDDNAAACAVNGYLSWMHWEIPSYGEWDNESFYLPYNYICGYYGENLTVSFDDMQRLLSEKFGIDIERPDRDKLMYRCEYDKESDTVRYADTRDLPIPIQRIIDVSESDGVTYVTVQFYADEFCLIPSHKVVYKIGDGEVFLGYEIIEKGKYEPRELG